MAEATAQKDSIHRVVEYPVIKDSLAQAHSIISAYPTTSYLYQQISSLSNRVLGTVLPIAQGQPLVNATMLKADSYANGALDYIETKFPVVNETTDVILGYVKRPADNAVETAKAYRDNIQSKISPVTEKFHARIVQGQEQINALQERVKSTVALLPKDKASVQEAVNSLYKEFESISTYVSTNAKELPSQAQAASKPYIEKVSQAVTHVREELAKPDVPVTTKASTILHYAQSQVSPLLSSLLEAVVGKKNEVEEQVKETVKQVKQKKSKTSTEQAPLSNGNATVNGSK